nr:MAG TPA: hypothetical protein [Bacteriophage sp.]
MIAKTLNYSGWINSVSQLKTKFKKVFGDIGVKILSYTDATDNGIFSMCYITDVMTLTATTFPQENCTAISIISTNEDKLYDFLSVLPVYYDILINDADNGIYPSQTTPLMQESEEEQQTEAQEKSRAQETASESKTS